MGFDGNFDDNHDGLTREAPCWSILGMFAFALRRFYLRVIQVSIANFQSLTMSVRVSVRAYTRSKRARSISWAWSPCKIVPGVGVW